MVSSKAKEERILGVSDPTRTQLPDICAEENTRNKIYRPHSIKEIIFFDC